MKEEGADPDTGADVESRKRRTPPTFVFVVLGVVIALVATLGIPRLLRSHANSPAPKGSQASSVPRKTPTTTRATTAAADHRIATIPAAGPVTALAYSPDGSRLAVMTGGGDVQVLATATGKTLTAFRNPGSSQYIAYSRDGRTLVTDTMHVGAQLWDATTGKAADTLKLDYAVDGRGPVAFSPDGKTVAHAEYNGEDGAVTPYALQLWDVSTLTPVETLLLPLKGNIAHDDATVDALAYSPDGKLLALGGQYLAPGPGSAQALLLNSADDGSPPKILTSTFPADQQSTNFNSYVGSAAFAPDGKTLATATYASGPTMLYSGVRLWNVATGRVQTTVSATGGGTVAYSPNGGLLTFGTPDGGTIDVWNTVRHTVTGRLDLGQSADGTPTYNGGQQFSPDGRTLAVPVGNTVQVWSVG